MKNEGFYIKKLINPRRPEFAKNQNIIYNKPGKVLKNIDNNLSSFQDNNNNQMQIPQINNEIIPKQNGQNFIGVNNIKNMNQNLQDYNINYIHANEESKLNIDNRAYASKALVKNYVFTNYINYLINNQKQNQIIRNNNGFIYNPVIVTNINKIPINNKNIINPGLNQQQILINQNINNVPTIQIQQNIIPLRKNQMMNGFITQNKNFIKKDYNQQRYATIQNENKYVLENDVNYTQPWAEKKNRDDIIINSNNDEDSDNDGYCSKINKNDKRVFSENLDTIDLSTPIKERNNLNGLYNQYQTSINGDNYQEYSNNTFNTPTKHLGISPQQQQYNGLLHSQENPRSNLFSQTFYNFTNNQSAFSPELNNDALCNSALSPIKESAQNQNNQYSKRTKDKIYNTLTHPVTDNSVNLIPNISKKLFGNNNISIKSFSHLSRAGSEDEGIPKINQDSYVALSKVNNIENFNIFAVLDGHGPHGHLVSKFVSENLVKNIISNPAIKTLLDIEKIYLTLKQNNYRIIKQSFISIDYNIRNCNFDVNDSGTTCVLLIILGTHLICANVGDSRAIAICSENNDPNLSKLSIVPLSIDFKLEISEERNRIIRSGGLVEKLKNSIGEGAGPLRVFKPGKDYPGLAMSRSIGDAIAKTLGVIAEPGIIEYNLNEKIKFIVLGSDGIWEFLSNEEVKNIGKVFYLNCEANDLCEELYSNSLIKWKCNDSSVDDITVIVIYF